MQKFKIPLFRPIFDDEMLNAVIGAFTKERFLRGESVREFEREFAEFIGSEFAIAVNSGTSALLISLRSLNLDSGDLIITPSASFIATTNAILMSGARPLFVDIEPDTYNINVDLVRESCEKFRGKVKGILPVHLYGRPISRMKELIEIAEDYNLFLLEDCAQAVGATYLDDKKVGSSSDAGAFSFYISKNLSVCGDGGMITTNDPTVYRIASELRDIGIKENWDRIAYTARMHSSLAAIGRIQLRNLEDWNRKRRDLARIYIQKLAPLNIITPPPDEKGCKSVFHLFTIQVNPEYRKQIIEFLSNYGIQTKIHYPIPIHLQEHIKKTDLPIQPLPETEKWSRTILSLPMFPQLTKKEIGYICSKLEVILSKLALSESGDGVPK